MLPPIPNPSKKQSAKTPTLGPITSQNQLSGNYRSRGGWLYRKIRDHWVSFFAEHIEELGKQTTFRRVFVTRWVGVGKRGARRKPYDDANILGGTKGLIDALVQTGVLYDDARDYCKIYVRQEYAPDGVEGGQLAIEDVEHAEFQ